MEKIAIALRNLGARGIVNVSPAGFCRYEVRINNQYFGIFDSKRNTFVD